MLNVFQKIDTVNYGSSNIKNQDYIKKVMEGVIDKYLGYMKTSGVFAMGTHPLVKLIKTLDNDYDSLAEYTYYVKSRCKDVESVMGLVTTKSTGVLFEDSTSIGGDAYFVSNSDSDEMITCKYTGSDRLDFVNSNSEVDEFSILEVNTVMMVLGYREWKKANEYGNANTYVGSIVLPMIAKSRLGLVLLNRMMLLHRGWLPSSYKNTLPIAIPNHSKDIDKILMAYISQLVNKTNGKVNIGLFLSRFPIIDIRDIMVYKNYLFTYRNSWLLPYTRFNVLVWLYEIIDSSSSGSFNKELNDETHKMLKRLRGGYVYPPKDIPYIFKTEYTSNKEILENRKK